MLQNDSLVPCFSGKIKVVLKLAKNPWKTEIELFP